MVEDLFAQIVHSGGVHQWNRALCSSKHCAYLHFYTSPKAGGLPSIEANAPPLLPLYVGSRKQTLSYDTNLTFKPSSPTTRA